MASHKIKSKSMTTPCRHPLEGTSSQLSSSRPTKRPLSVSYEVRSITAGSKETIIIITDNNNNVYKAKLTDSGLTSPSVTTPLLQKILTLDPAFDLPKCSWKLHPRQQYIKEELATTACISANYVHHVWIGQYKFFDTHDLTEDQISENSSIRSTSPIFLDRNATSSPTNQNIPPSPSRVTTVPSSSSSIPTTSFSNIAPTPSYALELLTSPSTQETVRVTPLLTSSVRFTSPPSSLMTATTLTSSAFSTGLISALPSSTCSTTPVSNIPTLTSLHTSFLPSGPLKDVPDRPSSTFVQPGTPTSEPKSPVHHITTPPYSACKSLDYCSTITMPKEDAQVPIYQPKVIQPNYQNQARNLLMVGAMPILPPCRRQWGYVRDESIVLSPTLRWPPKNWKTFSPDQRALAVEFAANTIEQKDGYHPIDPIVLLFKFNYLVLPNTSILHTGTSTMSKALANNYEVIRSIATNESSYNQDEQQQLIAAY